MKCRGEHEGDNAHEFDENVDRRTGCIFERIADGVANNSSFMGIGAFSTVVAAFDILLGIIPGTACISHEDGEHNTRNGYANEETTERGP